MVTVRLPQPLFSTWDTYFLQIHKISQNIYWQCVRECNCQLSLFTYFCPLHLSNRRGGLWCLTPRSTTFQLYRGSFIDGGNQSTRRKPLYHIMLYRVHIARAWFELTRWVVIGTDCIVSYISNYHTIMTWRFLKAKEQVTMTTINTNTDVRHAHQPEYNFLV